jgi:O-Antigen ligase
MAKRWGLLLTATAEVLLWLALVKTYSRGGLVAAVMAGGLFAFQLRQRIAALRALMVRAALILGLLLLTTFASRLTPEHLDADPSIRHRLTLWAAAFEMMSDAPIHGWGSGESGWAYMNWYHEGDSHDRYATMVSSLLTIGVEKGLPLIALLIALHLILLGGYNTTDDGHRILRSGLSLFLVAARASIAAWLVVNLFSTLYTDPRLWGIPTISYSLLLAGLLFSSPQLISRWVSMAALVGMGLAASLYGAGAWRSRQNPVVIERDKSGCVSIEAKGVGASSSLPIWHFWVDQSVLGPAPGKAIRSALLQMKSGAKFIYHPVWDHTQIDDPNCTVVLFGRQVERINELEGNLLRARRLLLIHPIGPPPTVFLAAAHAGTNIELILPDIDQNGSNAAWRRFAASHSARLVFSPGIGLDIRPLWPDIITSDNPKDVVAKAIEDQNGGSGNEGGLNHGERASANDLQQMAARLHNISIRGVLVLNFPIASSEVLDELRLRCDLEHRIDVDAWQNAVSSWHIPALQSWLVPDGGGGVRWLSTDGTELHFTDNDIIRGFGLKVTRDYSIRRATATAYEVRGPTGLIWLYSEGQLSRITDPRLGVFRVKANGGKLCEVSPVNPAGGIMIMTAQYNDDGDVTSIETNGGNRIAFGWANGALMSMNRGGRSQIGFAYDQGLVSRIDESPGKSRAIRWEKNPGSLAGDSPWYYPVHLCLYDKWDYDYHVTLNGYLIRARNRALSTIETTLCNPQRREIEQVDANGERFHYYY